jgi:3-O-methylgallate 3,4-dioxygenase
MAAVVGAAGCSHSPLLLAEPRLWMERAEQDRRNPQLYDNAGVHRSYDELVTAVAGSLDAQLTPERWEERYARCRRAIARVGDHLRDLRPDAVVVVGDDQLELFDESNQPAIALYWGDAWVTAELPIHGSEFFDVVKVGYAMDEPRKFAGHGALGHDLLVGLCAQGIDAASVATQPAGHGFGHAFGFVGEELLDDDVPIIPLLLNTYYPPNQPTPDRCLALGRALRAAIEAAPGDARVAVVASGGLSHFVVDERLDTLVLDALREADRDALVSLPVELLQAGSSEVRNWITLAGVMGDVGTSWQEYAPCYRSPAGTGCGMGFATWTVDAGTPAP